MSFLECTRMIFPSIHSLADVVSLITLCHPPPHSLISLLFSPPSFFPLPLFLPYPISIRYSQIDSSLMRDSVWCYIRMCFIPELYQALSNMLPYNQHQPPQHMNSSYAPVQREWSQQSNGNNVYSPSYTTQYTQSTQSAQYTPQFPCQYPSQQGNYVYQHPSQYPSHPEYPTHNVPQYQPGPPPPSQIYPVAYNGAAQGWNPSPNQYGTSRVPPPVHYQKMERSEERDPSRSVRSGISTSHQENKEVWGGVDPRERTRHSGNSIGSSSSEETLTPQSSLTRAEKREFAGLIQDLWRDARFAQEFKQYSVTEFSKIRLLLEKIEARNGLHK